LWAINKNVVRVLENRTSKPAPWLRVVFKSVRAGKGGVKLARTKVELNDGRVGRKRLCVWVRRRRGVVEAVHRRHGLMEGIEIGSDEGGEHGVGEGENVGLYVTMGEGERNVCIHKESGKRK